MFKNFPFKVNLQTVFLFFSCFFWLVSNSNGQSKADLEVKVQTASESARGGEAFSYTVTISNIGTAKATEVGLINEPEYLVEILSGISSKGTCEKDEFDRKPRLRCSIGELGPGETVTISIEIKINDFGDSSESDAPLFAMNDSPVQLNRKPL